MKNGKIVISIFSIIFITLCFSFGFNNKVQGEQINNDKTLQYNKNLNDDDILETMIPNKPIKENEEFNITIKMKSNNIKIKEYSYENNGFKISSESIDKKSNSVKIDFLNSSSNSNYEFTISVILENGEKRSTSVYGYLSDNSLFLSLSSAENAERNSLSYKLSNGSIDKLEYERKIQELSNESIVEEISSTTITEYSAIDDEGMLIASESTSGDTYVSGTLQWRDDNGNNHPLQYASVNIFDKDLLFWTKIGSTTTDANGNYTFSFFNKTTFPENGGYDIFIQVSTSGDKYYITDGGELPYAITSGVSSNVPTGSTTTKSLTIDMGNDTGRAFQISQAIINGSRYAQAMGSSVSGVNVYFPTQYGTNYVPLLKQIRILPGDYMDWDVILHEYGHHIQHEFGIIDSPGGDHDSQDNLAVTQDSKDKGIRLAWGESWPTVFALLVTQYYSSTLNNISNIGDEIYQDTTDQTVIYSLEKGLDDGEAQERAIMGVLYDLYDDSGTTEPFDDVKLGHQKLWNLVINSKATTFSEFTNYAYTYRYLYIDDFSRILVEHGMSSQNLQINGSISETPPTFSWIAGGSSTSTKYQNDLFDLIFYDYYGHENYRVSSINSTSYNLSESEWHNLLYTYGDKFSVVLISYETNSPTTGGYRSERLTYTKPTLTPQTESFNFYSNIRYKEKIMELGPGQYKDFTVNFYTSGKKVIQTFGPKDAYLYIYDMNGNLITRNDDQGYSFNSWIVLETTANTKYIIRVKFLNKKQAGEVKLGILPTIFSGYGSFESISSTDFANSLTYSSTACLNNVNMHVLEINETRNYTITTDKYSDNSDYIDMYIYLIDVESTEPCLYNDDGGGNLQSKIITQLEAGKTYLLLMSTYNITSQSGQYKLTVTKS